MPACRDAAKGTPLKMTRRTLTGCALSAFALLSAAFISNAQAAPNLVVNPGFDADAPGTTAATGFTGWTHGGNLGFTSVSAGCGVGATQCARLGPIGSTGNLSQMFSTYAGQNYRVSFTLGHDGGGVNNFDAAFAGTSVYSVVSEPSFALTPFTFTLTAPTTSSTLIFSFQQDPAFWSLDDVILELLDCTVDGGENTCIVDSATNQATPVDALGGDDTLQLNGATNFSFDVSAIGTIYTNFEVFQKAGASIVTLTGAAGFNTLGFDVQNGTLIAGTGQLGNLGEVNVFTPGTLQVASALTVGSIAGTGAIDLGANTLTAGGNDVSTTFSGAFTGTGAFAKAGTGTMTLSGSTAAASVDMLVQGGRLIAGAGTLGTASANTVASGATLEVAGNNTIASVTGSGAFEVSAGSVLAATADVGEFEISAGSLGGGTLSAAVVDVLGGTVSSQILVGESDVITIASGAEVSTAGVPGIRWTADATGTGVAIVNNGTISVTSASGIGILGSRSGPMSVINTGTISAPTIFAPGVGGVGVFFGFNGSPIGNSLGPVTITNSGTITGAFYAIVTGDGDDTLNLTTEGVINGRISMGAGTNTLNLSGAGVSSFRGQSSMENPAFIGWDGFTDLNVNSGEWTMIGSGHYDNATIAAGATVIADDSGMFGATDCCFGEGPSGNILLTVNGTYRENFDETDTNSFEEDGTDVDDFQVAGTGHIDLSGTGGIVLGGDHAFSGLLSLGDNTHFVVLGGVLADFDIADGALLTVGATFVSVGFEGCCNEIFEIAGAGTTGSVAGDIEVMSGGLLTFNRSDDLTYAGVLSGDGDVVKKGAGRLSLIGANNAFAGNFEIAEGTLFFGNSDAMGTGTIITTGSVISYADTVNMATPIVINSLTTQLEVLVGSAEQSGPISELGGPRPIEKIGVGNLTLSGANTYTGVTTVSAGTMTFAGGYSYSSGAGLSIASGASVIAGASAAGVNGAGASLTNIGAIGVSGNLYLDDNSTMSGSTVNLSSSSNTSYFLTTNDAQHGVLSATGAASVAGTLTAHLDPITFSGSPLAFAYTYNNVVSGASLTGTFGSVNLSAPSAIWTLSASYDATSVDLTLTRLDFGEAGGGGNGGNVGGAIEGIISGGGSIGPDLLNAINFMLSQTDPAAVAALLEQLGGGGGADAAKEGLKGDDPYKTLVSERLNANKSTGCKVAGIMWCRPKYAASGEIVSDASNAEDDEADPFGWLRTGVRHSGATSAWGRVIGSWGEIDDDAGGIAARTRMTGLIMGVDKVLEGAVVLGAAGQVTKTETDQGGPNDQGSIENYQLGGYGSWGDSDLFLNANLSGIYHRNDVTREIVIGMLTKVAHAEYNGWSLSSGAEVGAIRTFGDFRVQPVLSLSFVHQQTEDFTETGAGGLSLHVESEAIDSLRSGLGLRVARPFEIDGTPVVPELRANWLHEFLDPRQNFTASFADAPNASFAVSSRASDRDTLILGIGATAAVGEATTLYADYDHAFNEDSRTDSIAVGLRTSW
jgi:autotransporter-associated beta strand protein